MVTPSTAEEPIVLAVTGMTCAACAARIEKKLNRIDGISATVNYATAKAAIQRIHEFSNQPGGESSGSTENLVDDTALTSTLIDTIESMGYGAVAPARNAAEGLSTAEIATDAHLEDIRRRLIVSAIGAVPVMAMSMISPLQFDGWQWVSLALALPVAVYGAQPFHTAAWRNARQRTTTMDTLVSLGVIVAMLWSIWMLIFGGAGAIGMKMDMSLFPRTESAEVDPSGMDHGADHDMSSDGSHEHGEIYLEVATTLTAFILAGRYFEVRSRRRAGAALRALLTLGAKEATLWRDGIETTVPIAELTTGSIFVVRPGETVATDGVIVDGSSAIDASMITGESLPIDVAVGTSVTGGTLNTTGRLLVRATRVGRDTVLAQMARLVEKAQEGKAPVQRLADTVSSVFVPIVIVISIATLIAWLVLSGDAERSFQASVSVLIIACPCALGLATPVALLVGTGRAAKAGIIIKGAHVLEATRSVDTMVLDKTGTLTTGSMTLVDIDFLAEVRDRGRTLALVDAVEARSEHPLARAIVTGLRDLGVDSSAVTVTDFANQPGVGVSATADGRQVRAGKMTGEAFYVGATVIDVSIDGTPTVRFALRDRIKPEAAGVIEKLRHMGIHTMVMSGDAPEAVATIARHVGIDDYQAGVLPADKMNRIIALQAAGKHVAMVGDGVNDAAALAAADLGIAMGTGTDAAMEAGDLTIVSGDLSVVPQALELSRRTLRTIKGNLFWAFAYNVAAIPLAVAGLMNPVIAGLAMALSSVFVVTNSLRLRR